MEVGDGVELDRGGLEMLASRSSSSPTSSTSTSISSSTSTSISVSRLPSEVVGDSGQSECPDGDGLLVDGDPTRRPTPNDRRSVNFPNS